MIFLNPIGSCFDSFILLPWVVSVSRWLHELSGIFGDKKHSHHERYLAIYDLMRKKDRKLAIAFDDLRRSTAIPQIAVIHSYGLITADEFQRFSPRTREVILMLCER